MSIPEQIVRVFISSTFRDMHAERDHLVTVVFPEFRDRLSRLGLEFYDVDLRWGVPETDVDGERSNSWVYCKKWIERTEPFFIGILGQRYGWIPIGEEIKDENDRKAYDGLSITEMEMRYAVLDGLLKRRSYFYIRSEQVPVDAQSAVFNYFVDTNTPSHLDELIEKIRSSKRPVFDYPCHWTGTGFANLEVFGRQVLENLWSGVLRDERYIPKYVWRQVLGHDPDHDPVYTDEACCVPAPIWEKIIQAVKPPPMDVLNSQAEGIAAFVEAQQRWFQGRKEELKSLLAYIEGDKAEDSGRMVVIRGPAGIGKSALIAWLARELASSSHLVITHFVGATQHSMDLRFMLARLVGELERNNIRPKTKEEDTYPDGYRFYYDAIHSLNRSQENIENLSKQLAALIEEYQGPRRTVLIIDGVDQLLSGQDLKWLPFELGPAVRVVMTCTDRAGAAPDSSTAKVLDALANQRRIPLWIDLKPLEPDDVRQVITSYLMDYCKELNPMEVEAICALQSAHNPLYLRVLLDELRTLGERDLRKLAGLSPNETPLDVHELVPAVIARLPEQHPDIASLFDWVLERLEVFGKEAMQLWCTYLALGRAGMSSRELYDLLGRHLGPEAVGTALRIERGMRRYLQNNSGQLTFFHDQLRTAVERRYKAPDNTIYHQEIASYFETLCLAQNQAAVHAFNELPYHLAASGNWSHYREFLLSFDFMLAKVKALGPQALIEDYDLSQPASPCYQAEYHADRVLLILQDALRLSTQALVQDGDLLPSQLTARLLHFSDPEIKTFLANIRNQVKIPWLRPLYPSLTLPCGPLLRTLIGHDGSVEAVAVTPDGQRIVSGGSDGTLRVWDLSSGQLLRTFAGYIQSIICMTLTPDGRKVFTGSSDRTVRCWDLETGAEQFTYNNNIYETTCMAVTTDGRRLLYGSWDGMLNMINLEDGKNVAIDFHFISGTQGDHERRKMLPFLGDPAGIIYAMAVVPGTSQALTSADDGTITLWDLEKGKRLRDLPGQSRTSVALVALPGGHRALSLNIDGELKEWDIDQGIVIRTMKGFPTCASYTTPLVLTSDGKYAVTESEYSTISTFDLENGRKVFSLPRQLGLVNGIALTPDDRCVVCPYSDGKIRIWRLDAAVQTTPPVERAGEVTNIVITEGGSKVLTGTEEKTLNTWDTATGNQLTTLSGHGEKILNLVLTQTGPCVISQVASQNLTGNSVRVSHLNGNKEVVVQADPSCWGCAAVVSPDDSLLLCTSTPEKFDFPIRIWDLTTGALKYHLSGHTDQINALAIAPDGQHIISASGSLFTLNKEINEMWGLNNTLRDNTIKVWDLTTDLGSHSITERFTLIGHTFPVSSVVITKDGRYSISGSLDCTLKVWNMATGQCVATLTGHTLGVICVVVSSDDQRVVSTSEDGGMFVWDLASGKALASFRGDGGKIPVLAIAPDGLTIIAAEKPGRLHFLRLENTLSAPPVVTAWQQPEVRTPFWRKPAAPALVWVCPFCGFQSPVQPSLLGGVVVCTSCDKQVRLNNFSVSPPKKR
jgi:WD40 repeat protein